MPVKSPQFELVWCSADVVSFTSRLYERSGAQVLGLTPEEFAIVLHGVAEKQIPAGDSSKAVCELLESLRIEDLTLARACAAGKERAWEVFLTRFREKLYDIAAGITKESSSARELADSLYGELYGVTTRDGERVSKLAFYTGRGSLEGWLRTVLAQEHINRYRKQKRLVSLDEKSEEGVQFAAQPTVAQDAGLVDPRIESAVDEVLTRLPAEDRFVLAAYYLDERTLADIARTLRVHESTISRKLTKLAKLLKKQVLAQLAKQGMSRRQAQEALEVDVRDLGINLHNRLMQERLDPSFSISTAKGSKRP